MTVRSFYFLQNADKQSDQDVKFHTCESAFPFPLPLKCGSFQLFTVACACLVKASFLNLGEQWACKVFSPLLTDEQHLRSVGVTGCLTLCIQTDV